MTYIIVFILLVALSFGYYKLADRFNIIDKPNHRSSHTQITIRGGGVIFYLALVIFFVTSGFLYPYLFLGTSIIALVSFIDDIKPLPPLVRLPVQFVAITMAIYEVSISFPIISLIILLIVGVGFINAYNFMDGINALTGIYSIVIVGFLFFFNATQTIFVNGELLAYLLFSLVIFGYYNFRKKALFFSGDVGSISLAVVVFFLVYKFYVVTKAPVSLLLVAVYGIDSVLTIVRRIKMKEKISEAHRHHLYQIIVDSNKLSHIDTSLIYAFIQLLCCLVVYSTYNLAMSIQILIALIVLISLAVSYFLFVRRFLNLRSRAV
ncbi:UDP-GlcNAc--UDP-phosphate GlcNAc-1-phosphate transferase [Dokdonia sp. Asnod2-E02]|uniref:UDP-GlcNAc--UDP-phosphate GlcNAc-1-phosphate transferase n=1 Tax=Dokdonia sp. Asnod2-E02 TaxID=3160574 RepID=UPI003870A605